MTLVRWRPMEEMFALRDAVDRLFSQTLTGQGWGTTATSTPTQLAINMWEDDQAVHIVGEVPGMTADEIDISVTGNQLTIRGEWPSEPGMEMSQMQSQQAASGATQASQGQMRSQRSTMESDVIWYWHELYHGPFQRTVTLPSAVQVDKIDAEVNKGRLHITVPKAEEAKPKTIKVKSGQGSSSR